MSNWRKIQTNQRLSETARWWDSDKERERDAFVFRTKMLWWTEKYRQKKPRQVDNNNNNYKLKTDWNDALKRSAKRIVDHIFCFAGIRGLFVALHFCCRVIRLVYVYGLRFCFVVVAVVVIVVVSFSWVNQILTENANEIIVLLQSTKFIMLNDSNVDVVIFNVLFNRIAYYTN